MADLWLWFQRDLEFAPNSDLRLADGDDLARQRIIRRLLTPVRGYMWHLGYGAGLPQKIGNPTTQPIIQSLIQANIALESSVARYPIPIIATSIYPNGEVLVKIQYTDANTNQQVTLQFDVGGIEQVNPTFATG
jgi:hypothetical protein